jgi:aminopeptidase N
MTDSRAMNTAPSITRLTDYESFPFTIDSVDLTFELDPTQTRVTQLSKVRRTVLATMAKISNGSQLKSTV